MTQSTTGLVEIKGWLANSPAGPWSYRPDEYDDWGIVKCAPDDEGRRFVICQARGEPFDEGSLNQHRRDKTDPWEAPAKLIAAVPTMIDLLSTQETTIAELVAALAWRPISDTVWHDGRDVVLLANGMEVQARFCPGEWSEDTLVSPREYSGAVWSCFDDAFQFEIEELSHEPSEWWHGEVTHWRELTPKTALTKSRSAL